MKRLAIYFFLCLFSTAAAGQRIQKYTIAQTGCSAYMFCEVKEFSMAYSEDSSMVYTGECTGTDEVNYGVICVKFKEPLPDMSEAENVLISYLNYLKPHFDVAAATGYGKGHKLAGYDKAVGVIDYWKDKEGNNLKLKGWTDGQFIAVLYAYSKKELPKQKVNLFLEGFRFPGMK